MRPSEFVSHPVDRPGRAFSRPRKKGVPIMTANCLGDLQETKTPPLQVQSGPVTG
jgi:hypothetical protein